MLCCFVLIVCRLKMLASSTWGAKQALSWPRQHTVSARHSTAPALVSAQALVSHAPTHQPSPHLQGPPL